MQPLTQRRPRGTPQRLVQQISMAVPPVRGLNSVDPVALMPSSDAVEMDNFISGDGGCKLRPGWYEYATNVDSSAASVRTVMSFDDSLPSSLATPLSQSELFAATDNGIYLVEGGGDMSGVAPDIALSGSAFAGQMSYVQFAAAGANYLVACSETDGAFLYDGTTWIKFVSGGTGPGHITGTDPANFVQVCSWKRRLIFVERESGRAWALPVLAVGGTVTVFDFGPQFKHGGALLACINWTQDAGEGIDDHLVVFSTSGDLAVYRGNDITSATDFANVGTWSIGQPPLGRRCFTESGGNIYFLTQYGIIPVAQVVQGGLDNVLTSGTEQLKQLRKLQDLLNRDFAFLLNTPGWELLEVPSEALLYMARPNVSVTERTQYAFQMHSLAWSRILDIPGITFSKRLNETYAGTADGRVLRVLDGTTDAMKLDGTGYQEVRGRITPAFDYFGSPAQVKRALMVRANFISTQIPAYTVRMNSDLNVNAQGQAPVAFGQGGSLWDQSYWDAALWGGGLMSSAEWRTVNAIGRSFAPTFFVASQTRTVLASISYMVQPGGPL